MYIQRQLKNRVRLVGEMLPGARSVTVGIWVKAGSVTETSTQNGMSHFIEHMLFKGTENRTYKQIAEEIDNVGGQMNAFTSKECTCYYVKVMDEKLDVALDVLCDMFCNASFAPAELDKERGVVLEEIAMSNDSPEDVAHETLSQTYFAGSPLAQTILGPAENVRAFTRDGLLDYMQGYYFADNVLVAAVGNFDEDALAEMLEEKLSCVRPSGFQRVRKQQGWAPRPAFAVVEKDIEQVHIGMGLPAYDFMDPRKYAMSVVINVLGGSMSSRLFQHIREELGMAYSVYSYPASYSNAGMMAIYAGTSADNAPQVVEMIMQELRRMRSEMLTAEELQNTKEQLRGNFVLGQESSSARMNSLGKNMLLAGRVLTEEEILQKLDGVTLPDVQEAIEHMFDFEKLTLTLVGAVKDAQAFEGLVRR